MSHQGNNSYQEDLFSQNQRRLPFAFCTRQWNSAEFPRTATTDDGRRPRGEMLLVELNLPRRMQRRQTHLSLHELKDWLTWAPRHQPALICAEQLRDKRDDEQNTNIFCKYRCQDRKGTSKPRCIIS